LTGSVVTSSAVASADAAVVSYTTIAADASVDSAGFAKQFWAPRDSVTIQQPSAGSVLVQASDDTASETFSFAPPPGQSLAIGHYASAVEPGSQRPGDAAIQVSACGTVSGGTFDVHDIDLTTGAERIDVVYDVTCGSRSAQGEVAVNEPSAVADVLAIPQTIGFTSTYPTTMSESRPLTYVNSGSTILHPSAVQVAGSDADRFHVTADGCTGHALLPQESCTVGVAFAPADGDPQTDSASLVVTDDSTEGSQEVALTGTPIPGFTNAYLVGDNRDPVVGPYKYLPTAPADTINASGTVDGVTVTGSLPGSSDISWTLIIHPPSGQTLGVGTYAGAQFDPSRGSAAGFELFGPGGHRLTGTCQGYADASFKISQFDVGPSGRLLALALTWENHCEDLADGDYGSLAWRADSAAGRPPTGPGTPSDTVPPGAPGGLVPVAGFGTATVKWTNPPDVDFGQTIVRMALGSTPPATPTSGTAVYTGTGQSAAVSGLALGQTYSFSLWAEDTNGNLSVPVHDVVTGTRLLFTVPRIVPVGLPFQVTGRLLRAAGNSSINDMLVRFYARQPGSSWQLIGSARTVNGGYARAELRVTGHPDIVAKFVGGVRFGASVSVVRHPITAIGVQGSYIGHISPGGTEKIAGTVFPNLAGYRIYVQRYSGTTWVAFKSMLLTRTSTFSFAFKLVKGTYTYRIVVPPAKGYVGSVSYPFTVDVY
jgi:hypothetical protein